MTNKKVNNNKQYDLVFKGKDLMPAHPPEDYRGKISDWMVELQTRGLWNGKGWYGDISIPCDEWRDILEKCEQ